LYTIIVVLFAIWTNYCLIALIFYNSIYLYVYFSILDLVVLLQLIIPPPPSGANRVRSRLSKHVMQFLLVCALEFFMSPYISITLCKTDLTQYYFVTLIILRILS
jgi:hypothetical protein